MIETLRFAVQQLQTDTADAQIEVQHAVVASQSLLGDTTPATAVTRTALKFEMDSEVRTHTGQTARARHRLLFLSDVHVVESDEITLPDGTKPPILTIESIADPGGTHLYTVVILG